MTARSRSEMNGTVSGTNRSACFSGGCEESVPGLFGPDTRWWYSHMPPIRRAIQATLRTAVSGQFRRQGFFVSANFEASHRPGADPSAVDADGLCEFWSVEIGC